MRLLFFTLFTSLSILSYSQQSFKTIDINGVLREYYEYLPTAYDPQNEQLPVVFLLHGIGGTALNTSSYGMNNIADTARYIAVYPQGLLNGYSQSSWNNGTLLASTAEDLAFISRLIDTLNVHHNIDLSRVYMAGISMGSIMTYNLCRYMSDRIAAAACLIGTMSNDDLANFAPTYPVPTLHKHGTLDATVPYSGTALPSLSLVQPTIDKLKSTNDWQGDSTITAIPDLAIDGITVDKIVYNCTTPLELWRMNDADHELLFEPANDTNTSEMVWSFFAQYTHPNPSPVSINEIDPIEVKIYPNPANKEVYISNYYDFSSVNIFSSDGQFISASQLEQEEISIDNLAPGAYIFHFINPIGIASIKRIMVQ
jgi:polyhydroxybutyrate depolymerase